MAEDRCNWELLGVDGSDFLTLVCDFRAHPFPVLRTMQILYEATAELAQILVKIQLPCLIGVGPLNGNFDEKQWQLVLIPDVSVSRNDLVRHLWSFLTHLNEVPQHHRLRLEEPPPPDLSIN